MRTLERDQETTRLIARRPRPLRLLCRFGGHSHLWRLREPSVTLGRGSGNTLVFDDRKVSRHHARIENREDGWRIVDLGSGNGVRVNGRKIETAFLAPGDEIRIGGVTIEVL